MRKKKGIKINYHYETCHSVYAILGVIILVLSIFMINNFGKCKVYSLSSNDVEFKTANGLLILSNQKNMLKLNDIIYMGELENVSAVTVTLCVDVDNQCNSIATTSSNSATGMDLASYLSDVSLNINESSKKKLAFTKDVKKRIKDNLYIKLDIMTMDGEMVYKLVKVDVDTEYINNKIIY